MRTALFLAATLAAATPAAAQDGSEASGQRTVEGAQQFLLDFYSNGGARIEAGGYQSSSGWSWTNSAGSTSVLIEGKVDSLRSLERCKSAVVISTIIKKRFRASDPTIPIFPQASTLTLQIDWAKVTKVKSDPGWLFEEGGSVEVPSGWHRAMIYWPGGSAFFMHLDEADAERAAFAMQFLKDNCGFKTDTGF